MPETAAGWHSRGSSYFDRLSTNGVVKALYKQRQAVERAFSQLKGQRSLNRITVRRRRKVTVHCYLSLIAMQAGGGCSARSGWRQ